MFGTEVNNVYYHYNCYGFVTDTYYNVIIIIIIKYNFKLCTYIISVHFYHHFFK